MGLEKFSTIMHCCMKIGAAVDSCTVTVQLVYVKKCLSRSHFKSNFVTAHFDARALKVQQPVEVNPLLPVAVGFFFLMKGAGIGRGVPLPHPERATPTLPRECRLLRNSRSVRVVVHSCLVLFFLPHFSDSMSLKHDYKCEARPKKENFGALLMFVSSCRMVRMQSNGLKASLAIMLKTY